MHVHIEASTQNNYLQYVHNHVCYLDGEMTASPTFFVKDVKKQKQKTMSSKFNKKTFSQKDKVEA